MTLSFSTRGGISKTESRWRTYYGEFNVTKDFKSVFIYANNNNYDDRGEFYFNGIHVWNFGTGNAYSHQNQSTSISNVTAINNSITNNKLRIEIYVENRIGGSEHGEDGNFLIQFNY